MERYALVGALTWVGGVGAWAVGAGYAIASSRGGQQSSSSSSYAPSRGGGRTVRWAPEMVLDDDGTTPPSVEVASLDSLPAPPQPLGAALPDGSAAPTADGARELRSADEAVADLEAADAELEEAIEDLESRQEIRAAQAGGLQLKRPDSSQDAGALLTESQRRRLAPIKSLKRVRRSRKIRGPAAEEKNFVPLVKGARATTEESILNAYSGDSIDVKREQGEDYWVDPSLLRVEQSEQEQREARVKKFKKLDNAFKEEKLRQEIVAPYKNKTIVFITVGIGIAAFIFAAFPNLLELSAPDSIASFPDTL